MPPTSNTRRLLYVGAAAVALVAIALALLAIGFLRHDAQQREVAATQNLARSVLQTVDELVTSIDYVLRVSADGIEHRLASHELDGTDITRFLTRQQEHFPHVDILRATNAQGEAVWGKGVDPAQRASLAQRDYYKRLRDDPQLGMVIAEPVIGRISQRWIWLMARRINQPDSSFGGLVYASMFIDDLTRLFEQIGLPQGSAISLRDQDLRIVARTSFGGGAPALPIGDGKLSDELQQALKLDAQLGTYVSGPSAADGLSRLYSYRRSAKYGYTILVGMPQDLITARWQRQSLVVVGFLAALLLGLVLLVRATARRWEQETVAASLAARENERALLKSLIRNLPDLVWLKNLDGAYVACNTAFERFIGKPEADILGKTAHDLVDQALADSFRQHDRAALAADQALVSEEWVSFAADGTQALLRTTQSAMRELDGSTTGVLGVGHDITALRRQEDALRHSQAELERINAELETRVAQRTAELERSNRQLQDTQFAMDGVGIGITWSDFETGRFIYANRYEAEFLGYTQQEFLKLHVSDIDPNFPIDSFEAIKQRIQAEGFLKFETQNLSKDGRLLPVEMTVYYHHRDQTEPPRFIAFMSSIAQRKEAEQALRDAKAQAESASRAKSSFLANMSHEIRTPLNALIGLNHLLRKDTLTSTQRDRLDKMDVAGRHLLSIINDILDLSKVEAGRLQLETGNFHLSAVLDNVYSLIRDSAAAKGLAVDIDPDSVPQWLRGDATRLRQALLNFAGNAVKFTEQGRVVLRAALIGQHDDGLVVRFEVQDSGRGLTAEQQTRLFQPFEQADNTIARQHGGTGLGLALTKRLVELMQGSIGVDSAVGKGSTFWFTVPLQRGHGPVPEAARVDITGTAEAQLRLRHRGCRVLLAEDNRINVEVVQELLHGVDLDVTVAENGRRAIEWATSTRFDLILMDMQMPEVDGLEATRAIRRLPQHVATPILALTANAFTEDRVTCLAAGMDEVLTKPVEHDVLYAALLHALSSRASRPSLARATATAVPAPPAPSPAPAEVPVSAAALVKRLSARPGVDVAAGLARVRGRVARYAELVQRFVATQGDAASLTLVDLGANARTAALQRLHALKGAAGVLGLTNLAAQAAALEALLKAAPADADLTQTAGADAVSLDHALRDLAAQVDPLGPD